MGLAFCQDRTILDAMSVTGKSLAVLVCAGLAVAAAVATDSLPSAAEIASFVHAAQEAREQLDEYRQQAPQPGATGVDVVPGLREQMEAAGVSEESMDELFGDLGTHEITDEYLQEAFGDLSDYGMSVSTKDIHFDPNHPAGQDTIRQLMEGELP